MRIQFVKVLLFCSVFVTVVTAQQQLPLTGRLHLDKKLLGTKSEVFVQNPLPVNTTKKSPLLAGLYSLLLPGAGDYYNGNYWEAAAFAAIEITAITVALTYDNKGNSKTDEFEKLADERWSVVKYAEWLNTHQGANIQIDPNTALKPWERVNWDTLNYYEKKFSHRLENHGEQQYYELIGKYPQYSPGWDEFSANEPDYHKVPQIYLYYSSLRGEANDYYNLATKSVMVIYINHFISAVYAAWGAAKYNQNLELSIRFDENEYVYLGNLNPVLNIKYSF